MSINIVVVHIFMVQAGIIITKMINKIRQIRTDNYAEFAKLYASFINIEYNFKLYD